MRRITTSMLLMAALGIATQVSAENLAGSEWQPSWIDGAAYTPIQETFLRFEAEGRYFGNGGCNSIRGAFVTNDTAILLGPAAATMMACPKEIAAQEFAFINALMSTRMFLRDGTDLTFKNSDGDTVLMLTQRDAD